MLRLDLRPAKLNQDHKGKATEKDGVVSKLLTFGIEDIPIDKDELPVLLGEPHAYAALYNTRKDQVPEPFLKCFKALEFEDGMTGAFVGVRLKGGTELQLKDCKLIKIKIALAVGGVSLMSCKVQCAPDLDDTFTELVDNFGQAVDVEIRGDLPSDQQDLPLNKHGTGEQSEKPKGRGRGKGRGKGNGAPATH